MAKEYKIKPLRITPPNTLVPYLARWQENNSPNNLGIVRFLYDLVYLNNKMGYAPIWKDFHPEYGVAAWARQALGKYFFYEPGMTKEDRCFVFATYREGSKTFWFSYLRVIYEILIGQYGTYFHDHLLPAADYQILRAKNGREAQKRLLNIVRFFSKPIIKDIFGEIRPTFQQVKNKEAKDSGNMLLLPNGYIVEISGIEQPSRGLNIDQIRPKVICFDDVQNKENTKTEDRRKQIDAEVMEESFPAVADNGAMIYIGNKVHSADTLGRLLDAGNTVWKKQFHTITVRIEDGKVFPGVGNLEREVPEWGRRWTIERVKKLLAYYESQPNLGGKKAFLKEYYNRIVSDAEYIVKEHDMQYCYKHGLNWLRWRGENEQWQYKHVFIYVGNDPAISTSKYACDASVAVLAVDPDRNRYVLDLNWGKWDLHDRYKDENFQPEYYVEEEEVAELVKRRGSVEEVTRKAMQYHANGISIESGSGVLEAFFNDTSVLLKRLKYEGTLYPCPTGSDGKTDKLRQVPLCYFETGKYYIRKSMYDLKSDVIAFPDCRKDRLDSIYMAEQLVRIPPALEYNPQGMYNAPDLGKRLPEKPKSMQDDFKPAEIVNDHESWIVS